MNDTSGRTSDFVHDLGDAVRKNPLSAALIGMGALWLFTGRGAAISDAARNAWQGTSTAWRAGTETLNAGVQSTTGSVRDRSSQALDRLSAAGTALGDAATEYVSEGPVIARDIFDDARANLGELFREQPLALGAIGLAIGAAVAASLPSSELETAFLGEGSDYVKQKAGEIAGQQADRAVELGKKVVDAVADEARQQGLTVDGLKGTANDLSGKVSRVADAAKRT